MMSAPARLIAVRCSMATVSWSIQPFAAAALIIEYSPLTWYAATGTSTIALHRGDHVEVGERRLDHHHVGALVEVGLHLDQRLAGVAPVLLVALAIAAAGDLDVDRLAERAVQTAGVLGRVGEDRHVGEARRHRARHGSRRPGRPSSRSARRRARRPWPGRRRSWRRSRAWRRCRPMPWPSSTPQWPWSVYSSTHRSAITTIRSPTSATQIGERELHNPLRIEGLRADGILGGRDTEQDHRADAEVGQSRRLRLRRLLAGVLHDPGQRARSDCGVVDALAHEQRGDQVADARPGSRRRGRAAPAIGAGGGGAPREGGEVGVMLVAGHACIVRGAPRSAHFDQPRSTAIGPELAARDAESNRTRPLLSVAVSVQAWFAQDEIDVRPGSTDVAVVVDRERGRAHRDLHDHPRRSDRRLDHGDPSRTSRCSEAHATSSRS